MSRVAGHGKVIAQASSDVFRVTGDAITESFCEAKDCTIQPAGQISHIHVKSRFVSEEIKAPIFAFVLKKIQTSSNVLAIGIFRDIINSEVPSAMGIWEK